jgi:hypothetical protein
MIVVSRRLTVQLLRDKMPDNVFRSFQKHERLDIEMALVKHLLNITSYIQFSRELQKYLKVPTIKVLRNTMLENFDIIIKLKFALLHCLRLKSPTDEKLIEVFKFYGVTNHARLLEGLRLHKVFTKAQIIARGIKTPLESEKDVVNRCGTMLESIKEYLSKFVGRKHQFLVKSFSEPVKDILGDLNVKAIKTFYKLVPFLSPEHVKNSILRALHNNGINIIKYHTAKRRTRMIKDEKGGFQLMTISVDHKAYSEGDQEDSDNSAGAIFKSVHDPAFKKLEYDLSIDSLMTKHGGQPRKRRVLELLLLKDNVHFVADARTVFPAEATRKVHSTEEVFDALGPDKFLEAVRRHVRARKPDFDDFLSHIRQAV